MPGGFASSYEDPPLGRVSLASPASHLDTPSSSHLLSDTTRRLGTEANSFARSSYHEPNHMPIRRHTPSHHDGGHNQAQVEGSTSQPKTARDLSYLIDLMPPLSIEQGTKRLILAKKLDRENLDKYMGSYQSSINTLSQSSSASLTVHIKCQLRDRSAHAVRTIDSAMNMTVANSSSELNVATPPAGQASKLTGKLNPRKSNPNSILIPIHLIVTDENDNWPNFIGWPYIIDLNETAPVGSPLQGNEILAVDNDQQGPLSTIEYSIVPGSFWSDSFSFLNPLDSRSLIVKDNRLFDYESQSKLTLKVMARDQGEPPNWAITSLYINLMDQDDMNPVFGEDKYFGFVRDNRPGEKIDLLPKRMIAYDGDRTLSSPINYSFHLKTNHSIHFDLDPDLGQLTVKKTLPETPHTKQAFCLLVRASQVDNPQRFTLTAVNLRLTKFLNPLDSSWDSPKFSHSNYTVEVSEAALVGSTILTASASHQPDEVVSYQLLDNDSGHLAIDKASGRLTLNKSLDFEMLRQMTVRVLATVEARSEADTSGGGVSTYAKLACDIARVNINVINHNDYTPEFSHEQYNFQLSISDLIANFEPEARVRASVDEASALLPSQTGGDKMSHRFGEIELEDSPGDELDCRAIQLGQVYCADRDHGDRVSLKLTGSKANLFQLTQDGRLYLPLVNVSSLADFQRIQVDRLGTDPPSRSPMWGSKLSNRIINNQLSMSKAFPLSMRRSDGGVSQPNEPLDRSYLNYLLNELSNLGRLRLKVHASDGGQPEPKQSMALIVVTIVSIDNFIIQRAPASHLSNSDTAGDKDAQHEFITSRNELTSEGSSSTSRYSNQVMMIPSMNGREFVHINSDIIGNLLSSSNKNLTSLAKTNDLRTKASMPDTLESSASNNVVSSLSPHDSAVVPRSRQIQPPSLLLVDEEGAKFVAMPAAIEVYNQQVQEAAGQQARQKQARHDRDSIRGPAGIFNWSPWANKLGFGNFDTWASVPSTILLHFVILLAIIGLVTRVRSYVSASEGSNRGGISSSYDPDGECSQGRWTRRISNLGSFFLPKSSSDSSSSMLSRHQSSATAYGNVASSLAIGHQYSGYVNQIHDLARPDETSGAQNHDDDTDNVSKYSRQHPGVVSSGVVVSAMSSASRQSPRQPVSCGPSDKADVGADAKNQQNLFDHLKLTLSRMMDNTEAQVGQVSVRPLDSDVVAFEDQRDRQLDDRAQFRETSELQLHQHQQERTAISTFVGGVSLASQRSPTQATQNQISKSLGRQSDKTPSSTVVSINVVAPKQQHWVSESSSVGDSERTLRTKAIRNSSSRSSVVSLGSSAASSLSNKISEAVSRAGKGQTTGSDASSLNSSILLQGRRNSSSGYHLPDERRPLHAHIGKQEQPTSKQPPAPPPLPPPPSQIRVYGSNSGSPASMSPKYANAMSSVGENLNRRIVIPENPVYSKLRRETLPIDQGSSDRSSEIRSSSSANSDFKSAARKQEIRKPISPAVVGRREARGQANVRVRPPSPTEMPNYQVAKSNTSTTTSQKTVSPTTSVDRGYESFQSCEQSRVMGARQFSSLQDHGSGISVGQSFGQSVASLPAYNVANSRNKGTRLTQDQAERRVQGSPLRASSAAHNLKSIRPGARRARASSERERRSPGTNKFDCDTEDDDFYYCCSDLTHADDSRYHLPTVVGGLLSDYASHTYNQPPTRGRGKPRPKLVGAHHTSIRPQGGATSDSNDLIMYPCEYQSQNRLANLSQVCDMVPQSRSHPAPYQYGDGCSERWGGQQRQRMLTLSRDRHAAAQDASRQRRSASGSVHPSQTPTGDGYTAGCAGKKQLTWSDQVEMDSY